MVDVVEEVRLVLDVTKRLLLDGAELVLVATVLLGKAEVVLELVRIVDEVVKRELLELDGEIVGVELTEKLEVDIELLLLDTELLTITMLLVVVLKKLELLRLIDWLLEMLLDGRVLLLLADKDAELDSEALAEANELDARELAEKLMAGLPEAEADSIDEATLAELAVDGRAEAALDAMLDGEGAGKPNT